MPLSLCLRSQPRQVPDTLPLLPVLYTACCCAGQFFECIVLNDMRPHVPEDMPRDYSMLMLACWSTNPADRPTADRVLEVLQLMVQERQAMLAEDNHQQLHAGLWLQGAGQCGDEEYQQVTIHPRPASEGLCVQGPAQPPAVLAGSASSGGQGRGEVSGGAGSSSSSSRVQGGSAGLAPQGQPLEGSSSGGSSLLLPV
jgi:hypothetical protein